nr:hypothetical protein [uncultured Pedobacter sp.]
MKIRLALLFVCCLFGIQAYSQQILGDFSSDEVFDWPKVVWYRDIANNWDEGLIKTAPNTNGILRSGFGIHLQQSRQFTFWSTGLDPLLSIEGGSGKTYIKGNVGIGTLNPQSKLEIAGALNLKYNSNTEYWLKHTDVNNNMITGFKREGNSLLVRAFDGVRFAVGNTEVPVFNLNANGNVGIDTATPSEKLSVNGKIRAREIKVEAANWPDYVFDKDYKILGLNELDAYISENHHLPDVPSAKEVEANGIALGETNKLLLKKVEELTLYLIEQNKKITAQNLKIEALDRKIRKQTKNKE